VKRVLLDENLPRLLAREIPEFEVSTVTEAGWAGTKNGQLLRLAECTFDAFITADRNLPHQQALSTLRLGVIILAAGSTKLEDLRPLISRIRSALVAIQPSEVIHIRPPQQP